MPNVTILRGDNVTYREDKSAEALTPGMLVGFDSNDLLVKHASSGAYAARLFVVENDDIGNDADDAYTSGDRVRYADCAPGTVVYAHLASGQNVARGDVLMSNGAGFLTARTSTNIGIAQADEDKSAAAAPASGAVRFRARVI